MQIFLLLFKDFLKMMSVVSLMVFFSFSIALLFWILRCQKRVING